jgi:hypothetical protein
VRACPFTFKLLVLNFNLPMAAINTLVVVAVIDISSFKIPWHFSSMFLLADLA